MLGLGTGLLGKIRREQQIERLGQLARDADKGFAAVFVLGCAHPQVLREASNKPPAEALDTSVGKVNYTKAERFEDVVKEQLNDILSSETPLLAFGRKLSKAQAQLGVEASEELKSIDPNEYGEWLDQQSEQ